MEKWCTEQSSSALSTVSPNKPKHQRFEAEKGLLQSQARRASGSCSRPQNFLMVLAEKVLQAKVGVRAAEYVTFLRSVDCKTGCALGILCSARSCHSPLGWGLSYARKLKDIVYSLRRHQDPACQGCTIVSCSLFLHSLPSLISIQEFPLELREGGRS